MEKRTTEQALADLFCQIDTMQLRVDFSPHTGKWYAGIDGLGWTNDVIISSLPHHADSVGQSVHDLVISMMFPSEKECDNDRWLVYDQGKERTTITWIPESHRWIIHTELRQR